MSTLDLRTNGQLSIKNAKKINDLQKIIQSEYTDFIGQLIELNELNELTWFLKVTTRNTYASTIFDSMCRLSLLEYLLINNESISSIYIDRFSLNSPIKELLSRYKKNIKIEFIGNKKPNKSLIAKNILKNFYISFNLWIVPKFIKKNKSLPNVKVFLLDVFLTQNSFNKKFELNDRCYPGLIDLLPKYLRRKTWFLGSLADFKHPWELYKIFHQIQRSNSKIIIKEDFLKLKDYISAIKKSIYLPNLIRNAPLWRGLNLTELVSEENMAQRGSYSISEPMLTYLAFNRYKLAGLKIEAVVDWFENQVIDHALYLGIRKNFPTVQIKGYMGFIPEEYSIGLFPSEYEDKANVLPDELLVIGDIFIKKVKRFNSHLKVSNAPAFNFKEILNFKVNIISNNKDIILIALPYNLIEAERIIKLAVKFGFNNSFRWLIKTHPTTTKENITRLIPNSLLDHFKFVSLPVATFFHETRLLITSASSVAIEAAVCGVRVAIIGNISGPTIHRLSGIMDQSLWAICFTIEDLNEQINLETKVQFVNKNQYFNAVTSEGCINMLKFDKLQGDPQLK
jgi:hypothetical protein